MSNEHEYTQLIDASTGVATPVNLDVERKTNEVLTMVVGDEEDQQLDNVMIGRMPVGSAGDLSDFDYLPSRMIEVDPEDEWSMDALAGESDEISVDEDEDNSSPEVFRSPVPSIKENFPAFTAAFREAHSEISTPRAVRIDTDETYNKFVGDRAVKEISRRVDELRDALQQHLIDHQDDEHPGFHGKVREMRSWDEIVGAVKAVSRIKNAKTPAAAMPQIPIDIPGFAKGKISCWKDGANVVCSVRFQAADGSGRIATMAAKPTVDATAITGWASRSGVDPVTLLGALPDIANVATGKRLIKDTASAALDAHRRLDVCGMDVDNEPLIFAGGISEENQLSVKALAKLKARANAGHKQAQRELAIIESAAATPTGQKVAAPLLAAADQQTEVVGQKALPSRSSFLARYTQMGLCL